MDCNMREGRISWFKGGMLNVTGKSSGKGEGGGDGARDGVQYSLPPPPSPFNPPRSKGGSGEYSTTESIATSMETFCR